MKVAVVAHVNKSLAGARPDALRAALAEAGIEEPLWYEVESSSEAPSKVQKCCDKGAELLVVWGGDGMVQRSIDALLHARADVPVAIIPAGTANLLATNLGIERDLVKAVDLALHGRRRTLDAGRINGEHFGVMAGLGFDARMIRDAKKRLKRRLGKAAYVWTGLKNLRHDATRAKITVDGERWYKGPASVILIANVGTILGGITPFPDARPDDGILEVGVARAESVWEWARIAARTVTGDPERSPLVEMTSGKRILVELDHALPWEVDGGERGSVKRAKVRVKKHAITVCVPEGNSHA
jgi:YegS/Rv2252/BmrU family lipid kinase